MRVRQSPSGPFAGRTVDQVVSSKSAVPFATNSPTLVEVLTISKAISARGGGKVVILGVAGILTSDAAATVSWDLAVKDPSGVLHPLTEPSTGIGAGVVFGAPATVSIGSPGGNYSTTASGIHVVTVRIMTTAGNATLEAGSVLTAMSV